MNGLGILISFGKWGGFYTHFGYTWRVCLGFMAVTIIPKDGDVLIQAAHMIQEQMKQKAAA